MVRTSPTIGKKETGPVKRDTLGQKMYSRAKWFGSKVYDVSSKAALLAVPVIAGAALNKYHTYESNKSLQFPSAPQGRQIMSYDRYKDIINQNT